MAMPAEKLGTLRLVGSGRQKAAVEAERTAVEELRVHEDEALKLCDGLWPLVRRLEYLARELGPEAMQTVLGLSYLIARYERQHLPDDAA
jgi:hypothetical protein